MLTLFMRSTDKFAGSRDHWKIPTVHRDEHVHIFVSFFFSEIYYGMRIYLLLALEILVKPINYVDIGVISVSCLRNDWCRMIVKMFVVCICLRINNYLVYVSCLFRMVLRSTGGVDSLEFSLSFSSVFSSLQTWL